MSTENKEYEIHKLKNGKYALVKNFWFRQWCHYTRGNIIGRYSTYEEAEKERNNFVFEEEK